MKLWLVSFCISIHPPPTFFNFCHISSHMTVLLPLAANAYKDNEDGDHKGGCCCDGSQEQQVLVGWVIDICPVAFHDTQSLSLLHSLPLELKRWHTDRLLRKTYGDMSGWRKKRRRYNTWVTWEIRTNWRNAAESKVKNGLCVCVCVLGVPLAFCHCLFLTYQFLFLTHWENNAHKIEHLKSQPVWECRKKVSSHSFCC